MLIYIIAGIIIFIMLLFIMGYIVFRRVFMRQKPFDAEHNPDFCLYIDEMREGKDFFMKHNPQVLTKTSYDGIALRGYLLEQKDPKGVMMLVHGYGSDGFTDFGAVFKYYYHLGYNILMIQHRTHGESEGKYITFGVRERYDCKMWAEYLAERFERLDIFLDGLSMGCTSVLMAAGLGLPKNVRGVVADCGFTSPYAIIKSVIKPMHLPPFPIINILGMYTFLFAGFRLKECSTVDALKDNKIPVLFLHGGSDRLVPWSMAKQNYDADAGPKKLVIVENAGHSMSYLTERKLCEKELMEFLNKHASVFV